MVDGFRNDETPRFQRSQTGAGLKRQVEQPMDFQRKDIAFASGGKICRAWLYRPPADRNGRRPCIVMAHGLGGTKDAGLEPYATRFAEAGYVVLLFDYRHFGSSDGEPRQLVSVRRQLQDWAGAISHARRLPGVDPEEVALWGTSFSGGHVIVAAARDKNIAAVSAQCPMVDAPAASLNTIRYAGPGVFLKLFLAGVMDQFCGALGMAPLRVPLVASPGETAAMSSPDSAPGYGAIVPPHWVNAVCARSALSIVGYRPVAFARRVRCPALIQVCLEDSVAPPRPAMAAAARIGAGATLQLYDCGHFDIYVGRHFERASTEQLDFFNRAVRPGGSVP